MSLRNTDQDNNQIDIVIEQPDLRRLNKEYDDDKEFVRNFKEIPKPTGKAYDYMQMERLLSKSTLRTLYNEGLYKSQYLATIDKMMVARTEKDDALTVLPRELLIDLFFHDPLT